MKIGVLTFPKAINYGAALQTAALQMVLRERGVDASVIDYKCSAIESNSKVFDIRKIADLRYTLAHLGNLPMAIKRKKQFKKFLKAHFCFTSDNPYDYDAVITGSDQVWNYNLTDDDWFYFLNYPKKHTKKISYAASFGLSELSPENKKILQPLLEDFDFLSVREATAVNLVQDTCNNDVSLVLDPTLLLNEKQWEPIADSSITNTGYIFVYLLFNNDKLWEFAYKLSKETGLPIKTISYSRFHKKQAEYSFTAGPSQWLSYLKNADYVVTNSFHGVAFSINFQKKFFFDMPPAKAGVGSRISDITNRYALANRNISCEDFTFTTEAPDFTTAAALLQEDRRASFAFIDRFLEE